MTDFSDGKYEDSVEKLRKEIDDETDPKEKIRLRYRQGAVKFNISIELGKNHFEEMLRQNEDSVETYDWYASLYRNRKRFNTAIEILIRGLEKHNDKPELHELYADCLKSLGKEKEAIELLLNNLKQNPTYNKHYVQLAKILTKKDLPGIALECFRIGFSNCPDNIELMEEYALAANKMSKSEEALVVYRNLIKEKPDNSSYWVLLGNQYLNLELNDLALEAYKKANELASEKEGWIFANLGNLMKNRGFYSEGVSYLKKSLELETDYQYAHERMGHALELADEEKEKRNNIVKETTISMTEYSSIEKVSEKIHSAITTIKVE